MHCLKNQRCFQQGKGQHYVKAWLNTNIKLLHTEMPLLQCWRQVTLVVPDQEVLPDKRHKDAQQNIKIHYKTRIFIVNNALIDKHYYILTTVILYNFKLKYMNQLEYETPSINFTGVLRPTAKIFLWYHFARTRWGAPKNIQENSRNYG